MNLIGDLLGPFALISVPYRSIGMIIPDVTVEEIHIDSMTITDHPVETGAQISDHAFMMPAEVQMTCGWSNSTGGSNLYATSVYEMLRNLQQSRTPFNVMTGKRAYKNMLVRNLMVSTNPETENVLMLVASLREVIITSTQGQTPATAMSQPKTTAPIQTSGVTPTMPYTGSLPFFGSGTGLA